MNLSDLSAHAHAGHVDELNLISLEGGIYVLEARMDGQSHSLSDKRGEVLHLRSVEHARELLHELPKVPFNLVHAVVHDEMCGMAQGAPDTVSVPLSLSSAW